MAYDEKLAERVRRVLKGDASELKMFGGLAFMVDGKMACGVLGDRLIVKVGKDGHADAMARPNVAPFDFTGRPMAGIVFVKPGGLKNGATLAAWVRRGRETALKAEKKPRRKKRKFPPALRVKRRRYRLHRT